MKKGWSPGSMKRAARPTSTTGINAETYTFGVGPLDLYVHMARTQGWSEAQIERTAEKLIAICKREAGIAHRNGPVKGCPCLTCDFRIADDLLEPVGVKIRARWHRLGLLPKGPRK